MAGTLGPADTARLTDFARSVKAAARALALYPEGHPAVRSSLARLMDLTSADRLTTPLQIGVARDALLIDGERIQRPDPAVAELASMLHLQLVGELTIRPGVEVADWRQFLQMLGRGAEEIRTRAVAGRLWTDLATHAIVIREIDYAELLRERSGGSDASWEQIVAGYLMGDAIDIPPHLLDLILEGRLEGSALAEALADLDRAAHTGEGDVRRQASGLMRLLRGIVQTAHLRMPDKIAPVMEALSASLGRLSAEAVLGLLREAGHPGSDAAPIASLLRQMPDDAMATFLARNIAGTSETALERVAQAFHALVIDEDRRERLVGLVGGEAGELLSIGGERNWQAIARTLLAHSSDQQYVPQDYASELSQVRAEAIRLEEANTDPPERLESWRATVATHELRRLDQQLIAELLDLVNEEADRGTLMPAVRSLLDDQWQVGDFAGAERLLAAISGDGAPAAAPPSSSLLTAAVDLLTAPPALEHLSAHLATLDDPQFEHAMHCAVLLGERFVPPLVNALSNQERGRVRDRLTAMLLRFGAVGRRTIEQLRASDDAAIRRTAAHLLREFGAGDTLPDLSDLLDDGEPAVQREAVRAIVKAGTAQGHALLEQALARGTPRTREAIMQNIASLRDSGTAPALTYLAERLPDRGALGRVYLRTIELLGQLNDPASVTALRSALDRGAWWAPRRTAALRRSAVSSLGRIDAAAARAALEDAAVRGSRAVRQAARAELNRLTSLQPTGETP
jgi:hypothetical protein